MGYQTLEKALYADPSSDRFASRERLLQERLTSESTFRTGIQLDTGELFLAVPRELSLANERILRRERKVSALWRSLPPIALGACIRSLIMDEVVYSNEIEGVHSTRRQIELALEEAQRDTSGLKGAAGKGHAPFAEFAKLYLGLVDNPEPPGTLRDIRSAYDAVVRDALDERDRLGETLFRSGQVVITGSRGQTVHEGVSPESRIEEMLTQWLALSRSEDIPETYSALLCHFLFEYIHPFYDGNGRTGRYLLALHLSKPLSQPTVLSLSRTIAENKAEYQRAFDIVERKLNAAEATPFVLTMLRLIGEAQDDLIANLSEKQQALQVIRASLENCQAVGDRPRSVLHYAAQMELFDAFCETRATDVASHLGVSRPTARKAFDELVEAGFLCRTKATPATYRLTDAGRHVVGLL